MASAAQLVYYLIQSAQSRIFRYSHNWQEQLKRLIIFRFQRHRFLYRRHSPLTNLATSLGLAHSPVPGSIMFPYYKGAQPNLQLDYDNILAMYQLYS